MEMKLEKVTNLKVVYGSYIELNFDDDTRRLYLPNELKDKINNLITVLETVRSITSQSQSQSQIDITNTLNDIEFSVKQVRKLLNL